MTEGPHQQPRPSPRPYYQQPPAFQQPASYQPPSGYQQQWAPPPTKPPPAPKSGRGRWLYALAGLIVGGAIGGAAGSASSSSPSASPTVVETVTASPGSVGSSHHPAATSSAAAAPSTSTHALGTTLRITDDDATADVTLANYRKAKPTELDDAKNEYQVRATFVGVKGSFSPNPLYFTAKDAAGDTFSAELTGGPAELGSNDIGPGERERGMVYFTVPPGKQVSEIVMADGLGGKLGDWTVS